MVRPLFVIAAAILLTAGSALAQADSIRVADTTAVSDSAIVVDTTLAVDSIPVDTTITDSLSRAEEAQRRFEERLAEQQARLDEEAQRQPFTYFDTLTTYFLSSHRNLQPWILRSYYHDPGHYYKFNPGYFRLEWEETPMRHTVQPFALAGDRLAIVHNGAAMKPFEHMLEPDGLVDMNDIPTALDDAVHLIPGPAGVVFGGDRGVATLLTLPPSADDNDAHSAFLVDKGTFGYSYARARYARRFADGRNLKFSLGYRNTEGPELFGTDDDAYHWTGDFYFPLGNRFGLQTAGRLYSRDGSVTIQNTRLDRDKFDREGRVTLHWLTDRQRAVTKLAYRHRRSSANLLRNYVLKLNQTSNAAHLSREWGRDGYMARIEGGAEFEEFDYGTGGSDRVVAEGFLSLATRGAGIRLATRAGARWEKDLGPAPQAAILAHYESTHLLVDLSAGYVERLPSQLELQLPLKTATIYSSLPQAYADQGNPDLENEREITGAVVAAVGGSHFRVHAEATGGRIYEGIDWVPSITDIDGTVTRLWRPENGDVEYLTGTLMPQLRIADFLRLHAGGSYHYVEYELFTERPYTPEYQVFAGGELHYFWRQKLVHFFAYGEMIFDGPYDGWLVTNLGEEMVFNGKLSIEMGKFRFNFTFKNIFAELYQDRETNFHEGRTTSYGFVWHFLN